MPPVAVTFEKRSDSAIRFSKKLGRCIGWGCFSKKAGAEYDDLHGDHFPDDELFAAVGGLMKADFKDREIDIEHLGAAQGSIVTAWAMTEDVAKSLGCDTAGNYGVLVDFEPAAELLKSIEDGDMFALSMFGTAVAESVAKSGADVEVAAAKRKRVMRDVKLTKWAVCKVPAHEGAGVTLIKSTSPSDAVLDAILKHVPSRAVVQVAVPVVKRTPAATSVEQGHQHMIYDADEKDGYTSYEKAGGDQYGYGHSHSWLKGDDGTITILVADGHTHTIATEISAMSTPPTADLAKAQTDLTSAKGRIGTLSALLLVACSLPPDQAAFAKRLGPAEAEAFLAKSDADRAAAATPIYKSTSTGELYFTSDDSRLITIAKRADADSERFAKSEAKSKALEFAKRADDEIPHLRGTATERGALLEAVDAIADEAIRKVAYESLKAADAAMAPLVRKSGHGGGGGPGPAGGEDADTRLLKAHEAYAAKVGKSLVETASEFAKTAEAQAIYAETYEG